MPTDTVSAYQFEQLDTTVAVERTPGDALSAAWAEAQEIRERARQEGHAAGYSAGIEQARAELTPVLQALGGAITEVRATRDELVEALTRQAAEVSLAIAEQILTATASAEPERVVDVTRGALRRLAERHRLTVVVSPRDLDLVSGSIASLQAELGGIEHLDVQADRRISPGGCIVRTTYGEIDATIITQLQRARELVTGALVGDALSDDEVLVGELVTDDGI